MEAFEIESQTDQAPLASSRCDPSQGELTEAEYLFDDPDYWFDRAFPYDGTKKLVHPHFSCS